MSGAVLAAELTVCLPNKALDVTVMDACTTGKTVAAMCQNKSVSLEGGQQCS